MAENPANPAEKSDSKDSTIRDLKTLLLQLAARSDSPASDLQALLHDVIEELHDEVERALDRKPRLQLIQGVQPE